MMTAVAVVVVEKEIHSAGWTRELEASRGEGEGRKCSASSESGRRDAGGGTADLANLPLVVPRSLESLPVRLIGGVDKGRRLARPPRVLGRWGEDPGNRGQRPTYTTRHASLGGWSWVVVVGGQEKHRNCPEKLAQCWSMIG